MFSERITSKSGLITENELKKVVYKRYMVYICIYGVLNVKKECSKSES